MSDIKKRLTELVDDYSDMLTIRDLHKADFAEKFADYLIANGVVLGMPLDSYLHPIIAYEGLKEKYLVFKAASGKKVENCFILCPGKDPAAVEALRAYARVTENKVLSGDIYNWIGEGEG